MPGSGVLLAWRGSWVHPLAGGRGPLQRGPFKIAHMCLCLGGPTAASGCCLQEGGWQLGRQESPGPCRERIHCAWQSATESELGVASCGSRDMRRAGRTGSWGLGDFGLGLLPDLLGLL